MLKNLFLFIFATLLIFSCSDGSEPNEVPTASFTVSPTTGDVETEFTFDATLSTDVEDGNSLTYRWDFEGNGGAQRKQ